MLIDIIFSLSLHFTLLHAYTRRLPFTHSPCYTNRAVQRQCVNAHHPDSYGKLRLSRTFFSTGPYTWFLELDVCTQPLACLAHRVMLCVCERERELVNKWARCLRHLHRAKLLGYSSSGSISTRTRLYKFISVIYHQAITARRSTRRPSITGGGRYVRALFFSPLSPAKCVVRLRLFFPLTLALAFYRTIGDLFSFFSIAFVLSRLLSHYH